MEVEGKTKGKKKRAGGKGGESKIGKYQVQAGIKEGGPIVLCSVFYLLL